VKPAAKPAATWRTLGDVPEGQFCILGGGTFYRDANGNGPIAALASVQLAGTGAA
jgi:hypothetical protein